MNEMTSWIVGLLEMCVDAGFEIWCRFWDVLGNKYFMSNFVGFASAKPTIGRRQRLNFKLFASA